MRQEISGRRKSADSALQVETLVSKEARRIHDDRRCRISFGINCETLKVMGTIKEEWEQKSKEDNRWRSC